MSKKKAKKELEKQDCSVLKRDWRNEYRTQGWNGYWFKKPAAKTILGEMEKFEYELATKWN